MAKPYKNATAICVVLSIVALLGIVIGVVTQIALVPILSLLPAVIYEVYRTEGKSTKLAAWGLLAVYIIEVVLIIFNISFNLAEFLGRSEQYVSGYVLPLGDIKVVGPTIMVVLSIVLFIRTRGRYTKWLAVIIFVTSFAVIYCLDPTIFGGLLRFAFDEGVTRINI